LKFAGSPSTISGTRRQTPFRDLPPHSWRWGRNLPYPIQTMQPVPTVRVCVIFVG